MENNNKYQTEKALKALALAKIKNSIELNNGYKWHHLKDIHRTCVLTKDTVNSKMIIYINRFN